MFCLERQLLGLLDISAADVPEPCSWLAVGNKTQVTQQVTQPIVLAGTLDGREE